MACLLVEWYADPVSHVAALPAWKQALPASASVSVWLGATVRAGANRPALCSRVRAVQVARRVRSAEYVQQLRGEHGRKKWVARGLGSGGMQGGSVFSARRGGRGVPAGYRAAAVDEVPPPLPALGCPPPTNKRAPTPCRHAVRYRAAALDEEVYLHPLSSLASGAPELVAYCQLVRTAKRPYMAGGRALGGWGGTGRAGRGAGRGTGGGVQA
jgi:hypothetical protein